MAMRHMKNCYRSPPIYGRPDSLGNVVGSILQEVFLSYKNVLAVRSRWSQMWSGEYVLHIVII